MAAVHVTTTNNLGHSVTLLLDDERDAERINYLKTLVRREDLTNVEVKPAHTKAAANPDELPDGSVAAVLGWAGDDKDRARRALDAENAKPSPRKSLTTVLETVLAAEPPTA